MPNESNNNTQRNSGEIKADNYDKEKDTAQKENKQSASTNNNTLINVIAGRNDEAMTFQV